MEGGEDLEQGEAREAEPQGRAREGDVRSDDLEAGRDRAQEDREEPEAEEEEPPQELVQVQEDPGPEDLLRDLSHVPVQEDAERDDRHPADEQQRATDDPDPLFNGHPGCQAGSAQINVRRRLSPAISQGRAGAYRHRLTRASATVSRAVREPFGTSAAAWPVRMASACTSKPS